MVAEAQGASRPDVNRAEDKVSVMIDEAGNGSDGSKWVRREALEAAQRDVVACQEVYAAAREAVRKWTDSKESCSKHSDNLEDAMHRLAEAVGL